MLLYDVDKQAQVPFGNWKGNVIGCGCKRITSKMVLPINPKSCPQLHESSRATTDALKTVFSYGLLVFNQLLSRAEDWDCLNNSKLQSS